MINFWRVVAPGIVPIIFAGLFAIFTIIYKFLGLPNPSEMADIGRALYANYGGLTLLVCAFLEGVFMINIYFPGSFVILLAVFLSDKSFGQLLFIGIVCWLGFVGAGGVNYWLGSAGFYRILLKLGKKDIVSNMRRWLDRRGTAAVFLAAIHPNFLAIAQVCMGTSLEGYGRTLTITAISLAFWVPLWTVVFSLLLEQVDISDSNQAWYIVVAFIVWGLVLMLKARVATIKSGRFFRSRAFGAGRRYWRR